MGYKAIEAAQQEHFDLFLTDIQMPGIRGLEAAQAIREFNPELVCMVMTGFGTMETAIQASNWVLPSLSKTVQAEDLEDDNQSRIGKRTSAPSRTSDSTPWFPCSN